MGRVSHKREEHDVRVERPLQEVHNDVPEKDLPNQGFRLTFWSLGVAVLLLALAVIPIYLLVMLIGGI